MLNFLVTLYLKALILLAVPFALVLVAICRLCLGPLKLNGQTYSYWVPGGGRTKIKFVISRVPEDI